jgi:hypothetical protein
MATNANFSAGAGLVVIARSLLRATGTEVDGEMLKVIVLFCGLCLVVALLFAASGLDGSIGFF